ncbi:NmrA family NAD(P)-binding protein [Bacillus sp. YC2]|uniref:NmrA family NAD(P)-binding protein n=1 Tax=Bacillus sp. YC2 TaxID=2861287 RepID=UPI00292FC188|nr:NmrA family NAD(P)-binding protein [Bacillus sp. YC2]
MRKRCCKKSFKTRISSSYLVRDINSSKVQALIHTGTEAVEGNINDLASLEKTMKNADAVFSITLPAKPGTDSERQQGFSLIKSTLKSGVQQFIHTFVARAGTHTEFPRWGSHHLLEKYWTY